MAGKAEIYQLVFYHNGDRKIFNLDFEDKTNRATFTLTELDALTSNFANENEFIAAISKVFSGYEEGRFAIEYKDKGDLKRLHLVFNDVPFIKKLANDNLREAKIDKSLASQYMLKFLAMIEEDPNFLAFLKEKKYINSYFRGILDNYLFLNQLMEPDSYEVRFETKIKLLKQFRYYKTVRQLEFGNYHYELQKQGKDIPELPPVLTAAQKAQLEYDYNHPKKVKKRKKVKKDEPDGQMYLFDPTPYTIDVKKGKTR